MKMALMIYPTPWDLECASRCTFTCPGVAFALSDIIDYALVGILDFPVPPQHNTTQPRQFTHAASPPRWLRRRLSTPVPPSSALSKPTATAR